MRENVGGEPSLFERAKFRLLGPKLTMVELPEMDGESLRSVREFARNKFGDQALGSNDAFDWLIEHPQSTQLRKMARHPQAEDKRFYFLDTEGYTGVKRYTRSRRSRDGVILYLSFFRNGFNKVIIEDTQGSIKRAELNDTWKGGRDVIVLRP